MARRVYSAYAQPKPVCFYSGTRLTWDSGHNNADRFRGSFLCPAAGYMLICTCTNQTVATTARTHRNSEFCPPPKLIPVSPQLSGLPPLLLSARTILENDLFLPVTAPRLARVSSPLMGVLSGGFSFRTDPCMPGPGLHGSITQTSLGANVVRMPPPIWHSLHGTFMIHNFTPDFLKLTCSASIIGNPKGFRLSCDSRYPRTHKQRRTRPPTCRPANHFSFPFRRQKPRAVQFFLHTARITSQCALTAGSGKKIGKQPKTR